MTSRGMPGGERQLEIPVGGSSVSALVAVQSSPVVVIATHPWGILGGSMYDPHPTSVCDVFRLAGCSTVRFNFRGGVNRGLSSMADVKAVAAYFTQRQGGNPPLATQVLVVGYSYGSIIAAAAATEIPQCIGYGVICPPLHYSWALYLFNGSHLLRRAADSAGLPKLLMLGTEDVFCSVDTFNEFAESLPDPKTPVIKEGEEHFTMYHHLPEALERWVVSSFGVSDMKAFGRSGCASHVDRQCTSST